jgi:hypothetical protein
VCVAPDACHDPGQCDPTSGNCGSAPPKPDGTTCNDGNPCTQSDSCQAGVCVGASPVLCAAPDACHEAAQCDPKTGECGVAPLSPDGTSCSDGNVCTLGDSCIAGVCHGGALPDLDGDGHVDARCGGNDCSDADPLVWSAPSEVTNLSLNADAVTLLNWDGQDLQSGPGTVFDLASGSFSEAAWFSLSTGTCLQNGGANLFSDDRPDPGVGGGFWYLVRARNSCGAGTLGSAERDSILSPCP